MISKTLPALLMICSITGSLFAADDGFVGHPVELEDLALADIGLVPVPGAVAAAEGQVG